MQSVRVRCKCGNPMATLELPDNLKELVPLEYRTVLKLLNVELTLETITQAVAVLPLQCVSCSPFPT